MQVARSLNLLGSIRVAHSRYAEAETFYSEALCLSQLEDAKPTSDPDTNFAYVWRSYSLSLVDHKLSTAEVTNELLVLHNTQRRLSKFGEPHQ
jgi:hypothetical protein